MRVKNWSEFQHYKDRCPPWIKLHKAILDDYDFQRLPLASRALAPMLWLLASENMDGEIPESVDRIAFRLRWSAEEVAGGLEPLLLNGFVVSDSDVLAGCKQVAVPETEEETYKPEKEKTIRAPRFSASASLSSRGVDDQIAADWIAHRKVKKAAITETVIEGIAKEATKAGVTLSAALATCCQRGWTGFNAGWVERGKDKHNGFDNVDYGTGVRDL